MIGILNRTLLVVFTIYVLFSHVVANAVTCVPPWDGNRTVEATCTFPAGGYKVYGDTTVGPYTITIPTGVVMGTNLASNKITFTSGKILMSGTAKIDNSVSNRYYITVAYTSNSGITNCPAGTSVLTMARTGFQPATPTNVATSGNIYCAKA